jgi:L-methionine (R)-S-oxide reductase
VLRDGALSLAEVAGMPAEFVDRIQTIPIGKGMAGLAAERGEPVTICNLQQDGSGKARPDARESGMLGSIAVPITNDGRLTGVLGLGKAAAHDWSNPEVGALTEVAKALGKLVR